jgi:hypothetical protein
LYEPIASYIFVNRIKYGKQGMKRTEKNAKKTIMHDNLDDYELELKIIENEMFCWLISSAYPQVAAINKKKKKRNQSKKHKTKRSK